MNKVYNNYFSGSVLQVSECLEIILFNKSVFTERISLYNLENFYLKYLTGTSDKYARIYRDNPSIPFEYKKLLSEGFNVIVYISNVSGSPLGYTEFVNTQGKGVSLGITVNIKRNLKGELELILENNLTGNNLTRKYQGKEPYEYTTRGDITERTYRNLFTSDIERLESDIYSFALSSSGVAKKSESWKLKVKKGIVVDSSLGNYNICFYKGSLMLAGWEGTTYKFYPLTGNGDEVTGNTENQIERIEGRYYFDTTGNLWDLETGEIMEKKKKTQIVDFLDPHCKVYDLPVFYSRSNVLKYIPEINNIYLDLDNYLKSNTLTIHSKVGSWFILSQDYGGTIIYNAVSPTSVIIMTEEDLEGAIFVGDQTLILNEDGDNEHAGYYLIYNTSEKELITERARAVFENGRLDWFNDQILFCFLDTDEDEVHFEEYFGDNGLVSIVSKYEELSNTTLSWYRRNIYPKCSEIPELIGSYGGLIFYKNESIVNYL